MTRTRRAAAVLAVAGAVVLLAGPAPAAHPADARPGPVLVSTATAQPDGVPPSPAGAVPGPLPGARTSRHLGLPVALAVVALLGVGSLLVRVLLAEPAARARTPPSRAGPGDVDGGPPVRARC